jgi:hypothetical protein
MKRLGRRVGRAALAAFSVLTVVACDGGPVLCGACPGDYLDPNALIGPDDQVASIRVCIESACRATRYSEVERRQGRYAIIIIGTHPPNPHRIERLEVTTFDARNRAVRVETATSIDLPTIKRTPKNSCRCSGLKIAYDDQGGRLVITAQ